MLTTWSAGSAQETTYFRNCRASGSLSAVDVSALADSALADSALADSAFADSALADSALADSAFADSAFADSAFEPTSSTAGSPPQAVAQRVTSPSPRIR